MLGQAVYARFSRIATVHATDIDCNESWLSYADVRDHRAIRESILAFRPDAVINLAALTDLEQCERERDNAWLTNALGAENVGLVAGELDVPYVYISTAGIFDGRQEVYTDFDPPGPLSQYAKSKAYGETWVQRAVPKHYVVRAGWMMGGGPRKDKKFINKLWRQIEAGAKTLHVVSDKLGTPTYTHDFAHGLEILLRSDLYGLYKKVCGGSGSRVDFARHFVTLLGLQQAVRIEEVDSSFFAAEYSAPRPASEKLVNLKLDARGMNVMRDWRTCLAEYVREFR
jgi:dTDP-4-dehydrorhamnose reductase